MVGHATERDDFSLFNEELFDELSVVRVELGDRRRSESLESFNAWDISSKVEIGDDAEDNGACGNSHEDSDQNLGGFLDRVWSPVGHERPEKPVKLKKSAYDT